MDDIHDQDSDYLIITDEMFGVPFIIKKEELGLFKTPILLSGTYSCYMGAVDVLIRLLESRQAWLN